MDLYATCAFCGKRNRVSQAGVMMKHRDSRHYGQCEGVGKPAADGSFAAEIAAAIQRNHESTANTIAYVARLRAETEAQVERYTKYNVEEAEEIAALEKLAARLAKKGASK